MVWRPPIFHSLVNFALKNLGAKISFKPLLESGGVRRKRGRDDEDELGAPRPPPRPRRQKVDQRAQRRRRRRRRQLRRVRHGGAADAPEAVRGLSGAGSRRRWTRTDAWASSEIWEGRLRFV